MMAADTSTTTGSFNVEQWLKILGCSRYAAAFTGHGYVNYKRCVKLSKEDLRAVGVNDDHDVQFLMRRVNELRKLPEKNAVKLLSSKKMSLFIACLDGDVKLAQQLIANGANVNWRNPIRGKATPVIIAAYYGNVDMLNMLIDAGGDVNIANVENKTPVYAAAYSGHVGALNVLIRAKADVNAANVNKMTPVYVAAENGRVGALSALVRAGADLNAANVNKATPVYIAVQNGHVEALSVLISAGADFNAANKDKSTPVYVAANHGHVGALLALISAGADLNTAALNQRTPAHAAAYKGHVDILRTLHHYDVKLNAKDKANKTPLDWAIKANHSSVVEFLKTVDKRTDEPKQDNNCTVSTDKNTPASTYLGYWYMWLLPFVITVMFQLCAVYQSYKFYSMKPSVSPDSLHEPVVYGETVLSVVGDKPWKLRWPDYGLYLEVPEGALPPDVTASVAVKVISGAQFELPDNSRLISAVYWISSSEIFLKEVAVNIQHCAVNTSEDQFSKFKFVIAKKFQPIHFKEREGLFSVHTRYGTIKLNQFSLIAVTAPPDTETLFTGLMYYKQSFPDPLTVDFRFVVVMDLKAYLQGVNMYYQEWSLDDHTLDIRFEDEAVMINQMEQKVDSWKIYPLSPPPQVAKDAVNNFQVGRRIPHCAFKLQLLDGKTLQRRLLHKVDLTGVKSPDFFYIRYPLPESDKVKAYFQLPPLASSLAAERSVDSQQNLESENHAIHTVEELIKELPKMIDPVGFGIHLGLPLDDCRWIEKENDRNINAQVRLIASAWYKKSSYPTWNKVAEALSKHGLVNAARQLAERKGVKWPLSQHGDGGHHEL